MCGIAPAIAGGVRGHILITKPLTRKRLDFPDYQLRGAALSHKSNVSDSNDEYQRVVVYVDAPKDAETKATSFSIAQQDAFFSPEIIVVPVGSTVTFPNNDPVFHNVFSLSKAKQFDLGFYPQGEKRSVEFDQPGVVQVYCHIHKDMSAAILVVPNSQYVRPSKDGTFLVSGVSPGMQKIVVWHKSAGFFTKRIEVPASGIVDVDFTLPIH